MTDEEIVGKVQGGDAAKYGEIIEGYQKRLTGFVKKIIGNNDEVDDLVEESLIAAYENIQAFDTKKKFSSWIFRITHNKTVDFLKKRKPIYMTEDWELERSGDKLLEEIEIDREKREGLHRALNGLELKYKEVIILHYFEDKSYEEISDILHTTAGNVGVMINRAKEKIRKIYEKNKNN